MRRKPTIVVADTFGIESCLPDEFQRLFPRATLHFHRTPGQPDAKPHPHGVMVASKILLPLMDQDVDLHFIGFLDDPREAAMLDLLDIVKDINPTSWHNSWGGQWHSQEMINRIIAQSYRAFVEAEAAARAERGWYIGFAAGNVDTGGRHFFDLAPPQSLMQGVVTVGAHDRHGVVSEWTSDGPAVTCSASGVRVYVWDPYARNWVLGDGTSFASPSVTGLYERMRVFGAVSDMPGFLRWVETRTLPGGHDIKAGWRSLEDEYQVAVSACDGWMLAGLDAQRIGSLAFSETIWRDFAQVGGRDWRLPQ